MQCQAVTLATHGNHGNHGNHYYNKLPYYVVEPLMQPPIQSVGHLQCPKDIFVGLKAGVRVA